MSPHIKQLSDEDGTSNPKFTFDLHAEAPPQHHGRTRGRTISRNDKRVARVKIDNILGSHYKARGNGYSKVASLFITWESTDLQLNGEVEGLRDLFRDKFGHSTDLFKIPNEKADTALNLRVAEFVDRYNSDDNLQIIYYAGHGFSDEESSDEDEDDQLGLAPRSDGDSERGDPQALFSDLIRLFRYTQADVLLIVDCCFASKTFSKLHLGRGKFELLASSMTLSPSPGKPGSFTTTLIKVIKKLLQDRKHYAGFSTSILYHHLFHHPELKEFKPLLFDQSQFDYGKIWLRPQKLSRNDPLHVHANSLSTALQTSNPSSASPPQTVESDVALDLKLHLSLSRKEEIGYAMNKLAKGLQYLPHVQRIDFQELHAGDADVELFVQVLKRVTIIKKVIRLLRKRVTLRKQRELQQEEAGDLPGTVRRSSSFFEVLNKPERSSTQIWKVRFAEYSNGTRIPSTVADLYSAVAHQIHERRRAFRLLGILSISYIFDFTGLWNSTARRVSKWTGWRNNHNALNSTVPQSNGHIETYPSNDVKSDLQQGQTKHQRRYAILQSRFRSLRRILSPERLSWLAILLLISYVRKEGW